MSCDNLRITWAGLTCTTYGMKKMFYYYPFILKISLPNLYIWYEQGCRLVVETHNVFCVQARNNLQSCKQYLPAIWGEILDISSQKRPKYLSNWLRARHFNCGVTIIFNVGVCA